MTNPETSASVKTMNSGSLHESRHRAWFWRRFSLVFIPFVLLTALGIWGREYIEGSTEQTLIAGREANQVEITKNTLDDILNGIHHDTMLIRGMESLKQFIEQPSKRLRNRLEADVVNISQHRKNYDQIRYLNETGMEIVRVDFREGQATPVPTAKLQNKGNRYYFSDTFRLDHGEIFISPFDLNVERGQIEEPRKPMLRIGMPVFDQEHRKRGIVLINYMGQNLLERIKELLRGVSGSPLLLNRDGYWLLAPDSSQEWGFMYDNDNTMVVTSPAAWSEIISKDKGQFQTDKGLYTFDTIHPLMSGHMMDQTTSGVNAPDTGDADTSHYFWKVMTRIEREHFEAAWTEHMFHGGVLYSLALVLGLIVSWFLARAHAANRTAEETLRLVGFSVDHSADSVLWTTPDGVIQYVNEAACQALGYSRDELLSLSANEIEVSEDVNAPSKHWAEVKAEGVLTFESRYRKKNGDTYPVEISSNYLSYHDDEYNCTFARDITSRKQAEVERDQLHRKIVDVSRQAGMAEIASGVLHNVGNVMNSITVSASLAREKLGQFRLSGIQRMAEMLDENAGDLATYLAEDDRGSKLPAYLAAVHEQLNGDQKRIDQELALVDRGIQHIQEIVNTQQSYAGVNASVTESVSLEEVVDDSLRMNVSDRHEIEIVKKFEDRPSVLADKHRLIQIVINLVRNAKQSVNEQGGVKKIVVRVQQVGRHKGRIEVEDNGSGIPPENIHRVFEYGFTTKHNGRGFGLHHSAITAKNMGGSLSCSSNGFGKGAVFVLDLPLESAELVA
ncbi:MAG: PAS domain S-box protein [Gammaproteobacteria bacterium]|nr:PAS domain S-box protein [Gammaproteobacteria bacterium]